MEPLLDRHAQCLVKERKIVDHVESQNWIRIEKKIEKENVVQNFKMAINYVSYNFNNQLLKHEKPDKA